MSQGQPFKKVFGGDRLEISAKGWNAAMDVASRFNASGLNSGSQGPVSGRTLPNAMAKNTTGSVVPQGGVLGLSDLVVTDSVSLSDFLRNPYFAGVTPTTSSYTGKFAVAAVSIPNGEWGPCFVEGVFPAKIYMNSASDKWADVKDGDATQLNSGSTGAAQILWVASGTGTQWGYVRIGGATESRVKITSTASGSTPGPWIYNGVDGAGDAILIKNTMEPCGGTPGSLGVNVSTSDGTVNAGSCVVQPLGPSPNYVRADYFDGTYYWVTIPNSAQ